MRVFTQPGSKSGIKQGTSPSIADIRLGQLGAGIDQDDPRSGPVNFKPLAVNRVAAAGDVFQLASAGVEKGAVDPADIGELADVDILL
jgi:hypothetical protein